MADESRESFLRKHARGNVAALVAGAIGGLWSLLMHWPAMQWFILSLVPSILAHTYAEELDRWKVGAHFLLSRVFWVVSGVVFVIAIAQMPKDLDVARQQESRPAPALTASQVKLLRTLWSASVDWGADRMVVTYDGFLMPAGRPAERIDLVREVLGQRSHGERTPAQGVEDLVTAMPDRYVRLIPVDGGFDVVLTLEVTDEGRRYVEGLR